jgi:putative FmdB family regulatory protein
MPIYEYHCNACGHDFEVLQKISDGPIRKCEKCGRLKAKRQISQSSFILKGSGWYVTDYGGKKPSEKSEKESSSSSSTPSSSSTSSSNSDSTSSSDKSSAQAKKDSKFKGKSAGA